MEIVIDFPGKARVDAHVGPYTIMTDQPPQGGGDGSAPSPFTMFLSTIGTCAGIYVVGFCRQRNLPTENIRIIQRITSDPASGMVSRVDLDIQLPPDFPEKYKEAVIRSANQCAVKKHFERPPEIVVRAGIGEVV
jgi:putative redox protein